MYFINRIVIIFGIVSHLNASAGNSIPSSDSHCATALKIIQDAQFPQYRDLHQYELSFGSGFISDLKMLGSNDMWLDAGSGDTVAMREFFVKQQLNNLNELPKGIAITYTKPQLIRKDQTVLDSLVEQSKIKLITGKLFEDIEVSELANPKIITDAFGVLSYTHSFNLVLNRYLSLLTNDGSIYILTRIETTRFIHPNGKSLNVVEFLKNIPGLKVRIIHRFGKYIDEGMVAIQIEKKSSFSINVVPKLKLNKFFEDTPPLRFYEIIL